jgi:hypothetical protein
MFDHLQIWLNFASLKLFLPGARLDWFIQSMLKREFLILQLWLPNFEFANKTYPVTMPTIDENLFKGQQRKTDNIYIENPRGGHSRKFPGVVIKRGEVLRLYLEKSE